MTQNSASMDLFSPIEGGRAVVVSKGVYKEANLYQCGGRIFAAINKGFALLLQGEGTSVPSIRWKSIEGVPYVQEYNGLKVVTPDQVKKAKLKVAK